jgi:2-keto-4-pentenoate hydratase/2-oxohepta-3-ene-1,7-dioic acid hydratase in catechol pathway
VKSYATCVGLRGETVMGERDRLIIGVEDNFTDQRRTRRTGLALNPPAFLSTIVRIGPCDQVWFLPRLTSSLTWGEALLQPPGCLRLDAGVSLAVEVGTTIGPGPVSVDEATEAIALARVALDVVRRDVEPGHAVLARSYVTHTPVSAGSIGWSEFRERRDHTMGLSVNGTVRQASTTANQIADAPLLIAQIARCVGLEPGDIVLTGTPDGTAADCDDGWLEHGDEVVATIDGVGELHMTVVSEGAVE